MPLARLAPIAALAIALTGCINSSTLIRVKPDGSGTVENTLLMNTQALKMMLSNMGATGTAKPGGPVINEADLKRQAERMGGVRFVSAEPMKGTNGFEGVKAVFAFDDINKVQISQDPQLSGSTSGSFSAPATTSSPVKFRLARNGAASVLTISVDDDLRAKADAPSPGDAGADMPAFDDPTMLAMVKTMFAGFKVAIDLEVDGKIVKTNADHVTGSRVTLLEVDMGVLLENDAQIKALQSRIKPGASLGEVRPYLKDLKGVKMNEAVVTVEFR